MSEDTPDEEIASWGKRVDGTPKGLGYFGKVPRKDGLGFSTELSRSSEDEKGQTIHYPLIVPTLTHEELHHVVNDGKPTEEHERKAYAHAISRIKAGKSPFAEKGEQQDPPKSDEEHMHDGFTKEHP